MKEDNKKVKSFKIINKSKEGLIIILYGNKVNLTWEEFKADYVMEEGKVTCHFNKKALKKLEQAEELLNQGTVAAMAINSPKAAVDPKWKLNNLSILGSVSQKLTELLGVSLEEISELIQKRIDTLKRVDIKKSWKKETKSREKEDKRNHGATFKLGDLPAMQELKKKYGL